MHSHKKSRSFSVLQTSKWKVLQGERKKKKKIDILHPEKRKNCCNINKKVL